VIELNHVRRGEGEPLLLVHSLGGTLRQWLPVMDRLAAEREVVAVDMPGFGSSPSLPADVEPSPVNLAAAVMDFYATLGLGPPAVSGISLGGWVAIESARSHGASAAVALCPAGFWREPFDPGRPTAYQAARAMRPLLPLLRIPALRRAALRSNVHDPSRVSAADAIELVRGYGGAAAYVEANRLMCGNTVADLSGVAAPITVAWAEFDRIVRNRPLKEGILPPSVRQVTLPGCGHVPTWDDPELVGHVVLEGTSERARARSAPRVTGV
jgi:pimeloyl-ACP methyl ester carboxylesterase